jgi:hypothetical protein
MSWTDNFQIRYAAFLDSLGFKNKIKNAKQYSRLFDYLVGLPTHLIELAKQNNWMDADVQCTAMSDSVVISARDKQISPIGIVPIVNITKTLFWEFIERGVVIRGGVTKGGLCHSGGVVFGQALNDAVDLEKNIALFSRIVTSIEIAKEWRTYWGTPGGLVAKLDEIREDYDGSYYIDPFQFPESDSLDKETYATFQRSGPALTTMLNEPGMSLRERSKVVWLARQYNACSLVANRKICASIQIPQPT